MGNVDRKTLTIARALAVFVGLDSAFVGRSEQMTRLVIGLLRPYRGWLAIVFIAMLAEIAASLAAPWPLKLVLDDALGKHHLPHWLEWAHDYGFGRHTLGVALFAGVATLIIAVIGAVATYIDNYYTTSVGQWVANDLRIRIYEHLHRLSLRFYDTAKTGALMSTITSDVATIQSFASSSTLSIIVDIITIVFMIGLMFWLDWDFTLIALAITPFLLMAVMHFKRAVKEVTRTVRARQSEVVAVVQEGLGSVRAVKAFGRQDLELAHLEAASHATVEAALKARQVKSLLSPMVSIVVAICTAIVLWRGTALIVAGTMTAGALTVYLAYLAKFFKPVKDLASMTSAIAQTTVALERIQKILSADEIIREHPEAVDLGRVNGAIAFENIAFGYDDETQVLRDVSFKIEPGQVVGIVGPTGSGKSTVLSLLPRFYDPKWWTHSDRWHRRRNLQAGRAAGPGRLRTAGDGSVPRDNSRKYRLRAPRRNRRRDRCRRESSQRRRIHQPHAARLRHCRRRTRGHAFGRPAPTYWHCARRHSQ